jgi:hypothetical protein
MSEIYINYDGKAGFARSTEKSGLTGTQVSYADFKGLSADIKSGSEDSYGIILNPADVQDFIANYEVESVFTDAEKN